MDEVDSVMGVGKRKEKELVNAPNSNIPAFTMKLEPGQDPEEVAKEIVKRGYAESSKTESMTDDNDMELPESFADRMDMVIERGKAGLGSPRPFNPEIDRAPEKKQRGRSYVQKATDALGISEALGMDEETSSRVRAEIERSQGGKHLLKEIGADKYIAPPKKAGISPQIFSDNFADTTTLGFMSAVLAAQGREAEWNADIETTPEQIAAGAGQLGGFIFGGPAKLAMWTSKGMMKFFPKLATDAGAKLVPRTAKTLAREVPALAVATAGASLGTALSKDNLEDAFTVLYEGAKGGAALGAGFAVSKGIFPGSTTFDRVKRIAFGAAALDIVKGTNPFDERELAQKVVDYGIDTFFLWHGLPEAQRGLVLKNMERKIERDLLNKIKDPNRDIKAEWKKGDAAAREEILKKYVFGREDAAGVGGKSPAKAQAPVAEVKPEVIIPEAPRAEAPRSEAPVVENPIKSIVREAVDKKLSTLNIPKDLKLDTTPRVEKRPVNWMEVIDESADRYTVPEEKAEGELTPTGVVYGDGPNDAKFADMRIYKAPRPKDITEDFVNQFGLREVHTKEKGFDTIHLFNKEGEKVGGVSQRQERGELTFHEAYLDKGLRGTELTMYLGRKFPDAKPSPAMTEAAVKAYKKLKAERDAAKKSEIEKAEVEKVESKEVEVKKPEEDKQITEWKQEAEKHGVRFEGVQKGKDGKVLYPTFTGNFGGVRSTFNLEKGETIPQALKRKEEQKKRIDAEYAKQETKVKGIDPNLPGANGPERVKATPLMKEIAKEVGYKGRTWKVDQKIPSKLDSYWSEGSKDTWYFYEPATKKLLEVETNHPFFEAKKPRTLGDLPESTVLVRHTIFNGKDLGLTFYAKKNDAKRLNDREEAGIDAEARAKHALEMEKPEDGVKKSSPLNIIKNESGNVAIGKHKGFASRLEEVATFKMRMSMPVSQLRKTMLNNGVTVDEFHIVLGHLKGTVTKEQVMDAIVERGIKFEDYVMVDRSAVELRLQKQLDRANYALARTEREIGGTTERIVEADGTVSYVFDNIFAEIGRGEKIEKVPQNYFEVLESIHAERFELIEKLSKEMALQNPAIAKLELEAHRANTAFLKIKNDLVDELNKEHEVDNVSIDNDLTTYEFTKDGEFHWYRLSLEQNAKLVEAEARYQDSYYTLQDMISASKPKFIQYQVPGYIQGTSTELHVTADVKMPDFKTASRDEISVYGDRATWHDGHDAYYNVPNPVIRLRTNEYEVTDKDGKEIVALNINEMQGPQKKQFAKMPLALQKRAYEIGVKRAILKAQDEGLDVIIWSTGQMQVDLYPGVEQHIKSIEYDYQPSTDVGTLKINGLDQNDIFGKNTLPGYVGKKLAARIEQQIDPSKPFNEIVLKDLNEVVGGEGLRELYDKFIPDLFKKHLGKGAIETFKLKNYRTAMDYGSTTIGLRIAAANGISRDKAVDWWYKKPETERLKLQDAFFDAAEKVQGVRVTKKTPSGFYMYSFPGNLIHTVEALRGLKKNIKEAMPHVEKLGRQIFDSGKKEYFTWKRELKYLLNDMWESFKGLVNSVWKTVTSERGMFDWNSKVDAIKKAVKTNNPENVALTVANLRNEYFQSVKNNRLDQSAVTYLKTKNFKDYVDIMPELGNITPKEVFAKDPKAKDVIAFILDKDGNITPAIRKSGFYALRSFSDGLEGFKDISSIDIWWTDPTRFLQSLDQGYFGGVASKHIMWPIRSTVLAKIQWADGYKKRIATIQDKYDITTSTRSKALGEAMEAMEYSPEKKNLIINEAKMKEAVSIFDQPVQEKIVNAAKDARFLFVDILNDVNAVRAKRGQKEIPYRQFYRPHVLQTNVWAQMLNKHVHPDKVMETPVAPDFAVGEGKINPRSLARDGGLESYLLEKNAVRIMADYVDTSAKDIFDVNIVQHVKVHSAILKSKGLTNAARAIDFWVGEAYGGGLNPISQVAKQVVGTVPGGETAIKGAMALRRNLARAVFPLNWEWNIFIQTTSAGLTYARYGMGNSLAGLRFFSDKGMRQVIDELSYSKVIKGREVGSLAYQDVAKDNITKSRKLQGSKMESVEHYANYFTRNIEDGLTGHAIVAAYAHGKKLGLTGRALHEFAHEGGAKTQEMYNKADKAGILRAPEMGTIIPFHTFIFGMLNSLRELKLPVVKVLLKPTGAYETIAASSAAGQGLLHNRMKILLRFMAVAYVTNAVVDMAIGRKPWEVSSFVPFYGLVGGMLSDGYTTRGLPVPAQYVKEFYRSLRDYYIHGDFKKLRKWLLRYHVVAGVQLDRVISGTEAVLDGAVHDVTGRELFKIEEFDEQLRAIVSGPWQTKAGREYWEKREEKAEENSSWLLKREKVDEAKSKSNSKGLKGLDSKGLKGLDNKGLK